MKKLINGPAAFLFLGTALLFSQTPKGLTGWHYPGPSIAKAKWRSTSPTHFLKINGDFDHSGKKEVAQILVSPDKKHYALFVIVPDNPKPSLLTQGDISELDDVGIDNSTPGTYQTACGKGYGDWACAHGEPESLTVVASDIYFFFNESSSFIFHWDSKKKQFRKIQMSD